MLKEFNEDDIKNKNIVIYGIMTNGSLAYKSLKKRGIEITAFADSRCQDFFMGKPVWNIDNLCEQYCRGTIVILLAVSKARKDVVETLLKQGIDTFYDVEKLIFDEKFDKSELTEPEWETYSKYRRSYNHYKVIAHKNEGLYINTLDLVITEKCSLKCKGCSNLMQYYANPEHLDLEELKSSFDKILQKADFISRAIIIGGEPFMNPQFYKIIEWYIDHPKIGNIEICTNGTIFPKEEVLDRLIHRKITMRISDYGDLSYNLDRWIDFCKTNEIDYRISKLDVWNDCGELRKRNYSRQMQKEVYVKCSCKNLPSLIRGRLYNCPYAANAANLHAVEEKEAKLDCLDLRRDDVDYSKEDIRNFLYEREYLEACNYCSGRMWESHFKKVTEGTGMLPHQQLSEPEKYLYHNYSEN